MAPEDDDDEGAREPDDVPRGARPDPLDRPWVHPSELHSFVATPPAPPREVRPREWAIGLGSAVTAVVATVLVLVAFGALGDRHRVASPPPIVATQDEIVDYAVADRVAASARPSLVTVRVAGADGPQPVGSGVAIRSNRVMTNAHLVGGATSLDVVTDDGQALSVKVIGTDPQTDLALLAVTDGDLSITSLGSSSPARIGTTVIAVAATRGGRYRADIGVVSDQNRLVDTGTGAMVAGLLETGIQNAPAWSGGALLDPDGSLVGILTSPSTPVQGGQLAIPIGIVRDVEDQLDASGGKVSHGWMGVLFGKDAVDRIEGGARIAVVAPGSPAAKADLHAGDVVTQAGDNQVTGMADLVAAVRELRPQDPLDLAYVGSDGKNHHTRVTLDAGDPQYLAVWPGMG